MTTKLGVYRAALTNSNVRAFLEVIARGETVPQNDQAYRWLFGSTVRSPKLFDSFDDHPRVKTWEKNDEFVKNGKPDYTTAAGKYQIVASTWDSTIKARIGKTDFGPANQDLAAVALIDFRGALADVMLGHVVQAIEKCRNEWASLPGSSYGQPTQKLADALNAYKKYGGALADQLPPPSPTPATSPVPAGEAADYGSISEKPMTPLLTGLAYNLIEMFAPIARDKIKKELTRHSDNPEVVEQITTNVIEAAKAVTKQDNPVVAVSEVIKAPELVTQVEEDSSDRLDAMIPLLDKLFEMDKATWSAEEASRDAAAARGGVMEDRDVGRLLIVGALVVMALLIAMIGAIVIIEMFRRPNGEASTQSWAALMGIIGTVTGVVVTIYSYRFGSSKTSSAKDVIIDKLSDKRSSK